VTLQVTNEADLKGMMDEKAYEKFCAALEK
jgi:hypothetical protein